MDAGELMESYECTFEGKSFCCLVTIDPVHGNAQIGSTVAVRSYINGKRNFANCMLIFR